MTFNFGVDIWVDTGRDAVIRACQRILESGSLVVPRGKVTRELCFARIRIDDPTDVVADRINRQGLWPAIGFGEALQCIAGESAPGLMADISSGFPKPSSRWATDVPTYGERLGESHQLEAAVRTLRDDPASRQAVAIIWREFDMDLGQAHNLCTIGMQFLMRRGELHMATHMRSNDAWHGLPYDIQQFTAIQCSVAASLEVEVGQYVHTANSLHLYEQHWEKAAELKYDRVSDKVDYPAAVGRSGDDWATIQGRARKLLRGRPLDGPVTDSEFRYVGELARFIHKEGKA